MGTLKCEKVITKEQYDSYKNGKEEDNKLFYAMDLRDEISNKIKPFVKFVNSEKDGKKYEAGILIFPNSADENKKEQLEFKTEITKEEFKAIYEKTLLYEMVHLLLNNNYVSLEPNKLAVTLKLYNANDYEYDEKNQKLIL